MENPTDDLTVSRAVLKEQWKRTMGKTEPKEPFPAHAFLVKWHENALKACAPAEPIELTLPDGSVKGSQLIAEHEQLLQLTKTLAAALQKISKPVRKEMNDWLCDEPIKDDLRDGLLAGEQALQAAKDAGVV